MPFRWTQPWKQKPQHESSNGTRDSKLSKPLGHWDAEFQEPPVTSVASSTRYRPAWLRSPVSWLPLAWHAVGTCLLRTIERPPKNTANMGRSDPPTHRASSIMTNKTSRSVFLGFTTVLCDALAFYGPVADPHLMARLNSSL